MNKDTPIKLKKNLEITELNGDKAMVDFETGNYYIIKGAGNIIWDMLYEDITANDIIEKLLSEYDVSREECERSVIEFLDKLKKADFI
jgi:hypothetical protein